MQQLRQLDAQADAQLTPGPPPGSMEAAAARQGEQGQQRDSKPGEGEGSWDEAERAAFVLGLHLWGKSFVAIQTLVETKPVRAPSHRDIFRRWEQLSAFLLPLPCRWVATVSWSMLRAPT